MSSWLRGVILVGFLAVGSARAAEVVAPPPLSAAAICQRKLLQVDGELHRRLHPVRLDLDRETNETIEKSEELARYLESKGEDELEEKLLAEARKRGIVVDVVSDSEADPNGGRIYINRTVVVAGGPKLKKQIRHELSHVLFQHLKYLRTNDACLIFLREVDAHLWAGESYENAVFVTLQNYAGFFKNKLDDYRDPQRPRDYMALARNIRAAYPNDLPNFTLLRDVR